MNWKHQIKLLLLYGWEQDKPAWTPCFPGMKITRVGGKIIPDSLPPGEEAVQGVQGKLLHRYKAHDKLIPAK